MNNSKVEQNFINWCRQLDPDVNPYIFIREYRKYSEEYMPLIEKDSLTIYHETRKKKPNVNFSFKGRVKSKRSYLIKKFISIAENIKSIFSNELDDSDREKKFEKYFKFLLIDNPEKYNELKKKTQSLISTLDYEKAFSIIFHELTKEEKDKLIERLGRTEDTYAYRLIVQSIDFPVSSIEASDNSKFYVTNQDGKKIPINPAIRLNPEKDIIHSEENDIYYVMINGKKEILNERNLLYPSNLPSDQRMIQNAQKDENGNITLLGDSFVCNDDTHFDIIDITTNPNDNSIFINDSNGKSKNLSLLLEEGSLKLRKHDEKTLKKEVYEMHDIIKNLYKENDFYPIENREKDYIAIPKLISLYMSLHGSAIHKKYKYSIEEQTRTLSMDDRTKNKKKSLKIGHDFYKKEKLKKYYKNKILAKILSKDPTAFDSSTPTLMELLENDNAELSEILGKYILVTTLSNGSSISYQPTIDVVFNHVFHKFHTQSTPSSDSLHKLNFSSYENFIASKEEIYHTQNSSNIFPDFYDD